MQISSSLIVYWIIWIVSVIISIGLPIALFIVLYKKYNVKTLPLILGIAGFMIFTFILEKYTNILFAMYFVFREKESLVWIERLVLILSGLFVASIFEETARFIAFKILKKKHTGIETALFYGIGYIGIEGIITTGIPLISLVIYTIENIGNTDIIQIPMLGKVILAGELARISNICLQMSCSVIVFYSVYGTKKLWLYPLAIILHAIIDIPKVAMHNMIEDMILEEFFKILYAIALIIIAKYIHKKLKKSIDNGTTGV